MEPEECNVLIDSTQTEVQSLISQSDGPLALGRLSVRSYPLYAARSWQSFMPPSQFPPMKEKHLFIYINYSFILFHF